MTSADAFLMSLTFAFPCAADVRCEYLFGSAKKRVSNLSVFLGGEKEVNAETASLWSNFDLIVKAGEHLWFTAYQGFPAWSTVPPMLSNSPEL